MKRFFAILLCCVLLGSTTALADRVPLFADQPEVELTLWVDWNWVGFDSYEGGICQDWMIDQTGVKINMIKATDSEQLGLMIASGELPDLVVCSSGTKVRALSDSSLCYPPAGAHRPVRARVADFRCGEADECVLLHRRKLLHAQE